MYEDELIFLDIGLYELRKMTIISDIDHITMNSILINLHCFMLGFFLVFFFSSNFSLLHLKFYFWRLQKFFFKEEGNIAVHIYMKV